MQIGRNEIQAKRDNLFMDFKYNVLSNSLRQLLSKILTSEFINKFKIANSYSYQLLKKMVNLVISIFVVCCIDFLIFERYLYI